MPAGSGRRQIVNRGEPAISRTSLRCSRAGSSAKILFLQNYPLGCISAKFARSPAPRDLRFGGVRSLPASRFSAKLRSRTFLVSLFSQDYAYAHLDGTLRRSGSPEG